MSSDQRKVLEQQAANLSAVRRQAFFGTESQTSEEPKTKPAQFKPLTEQTVDCLAIPAVDCWHTFSIVSRTDRLQASAG
jgi:hypothetical protein